jgi:hypothetical protein
MQQRGASQVRTAMEDVVKNGQSKVHINPAYAPKPGPAPASAKPAASPKPAAN